MAGPHHSSSPPRKRSPSSPAARTDRGNAGPRRREEPGRPRCPGPATRLIGRERRWRPSPSPLRTGQTRLLTLTGHRWSRQDAAGHRRCRGGEPRAFPDGVVWVELALRSSVPPTEAIPLVAGAIARALGTREPAPAAPAASLATAIGARKLALILDNFEHLLSAAPLISAVLAECPQPWCWSTSRRNPHLQGEREVVVQPACPSPLADEVTSGEATGMPVVPAVRLFVERAVEVRGDFALTEPTPRPSPPCAGTWMGCRWPSSWRCAGSRCSHQTR